MKKKGLLKKIGIAIVALIEEDVDNPATEKVFATRRELAPAFGSVAQSE